MQSAMQATHQSHSFQRIYESHENFIRKIIRGFRFSNATEDDLVQDVFFTAWQKLPSLKDPNAFSGWIGTIAKNRCFDAAKTLRTEKKRLVYVDNMDSSANTMESRTILGLTLANFEEHMAVLEALIKEHRDPTRRQVASMFYLERCSTGEIARTLNMSQNTVLSHLRRFRIVAALAMNQWIKNREDATFKSDF